MRRKLFKKIDKTLFQSSVATHQIIPEAQRLKATIVPLQMMSFGLRT